MRSSVRAANAAIAAASASTVTSKKVAYPKGKGGTPATSASAAMVTSAHVTSAHVAAPAAAPVAAPATAPVAAVTSPAPVPLSRAGSNSAQWPFLALPCWSIY